MKVPPPHLTSLALMVTAVSLVFRASPDLPANSLSFSHGNPTGTDSWPPSPEVGLRQERKQDMFIAKVGPCFR